MVRAVLFQQVFMCCVVLIFRNKNMNMTLCKQIFIIAQTHRTTQRRPADRPSHRRPAMRSARILMSLVTGSLRAQAAGRAAGGCSSCRHAHREELAVARHQKLPPAWRQHRLDQDPAAVIACGVEAFHRGEQVALVTATCHIQALIDHRSGATPPWLEHWRGHRHSFFLRNRNWLLSGHQDDEFVVQ